MQDLRSFQRPLLRITIFALSPTRFLHLLDLFNPKRSISFHHHAFIQFVVELPVISIDLRSYIHKTVGGFRVEFT